MEEGEGTKKSNEGRSSSVVPPQSQAWFKPWATTDGDQSKPQMKLEYNLQILGKNLYLAKRGDWKNVCFSSRDVVLEQGPWRIANQPIILGKWQRMLKVRKDDEKSIPVWVRFHNIPFEFWDEEALGQVASRTLGKGKQDPLFLPDKDGTSNQGAEEADGWSRGPEEVDTEREEEDNLSQHHTEKEEGNGIKTITSVQPIKQGNGGKKGTKSSNRKKEKRY
ncbi:hypothetical protein Acr_24g0005650 [Actinidia rufa]|uniref:DUF4283 domain-containing protein n=1 Tax=Actinidia rufa TaxID=165716 RepID=A0A7J0GU57_9ERIC|nr:hypothetical protein Acr_24g0005650 [Actinidia rufa]